MAKRKVAVQGGDIYEINDYEGKFRICKVDVGLLTDRRRDIGNTKSLEDALALIRSYSGKQIKDVY